jgi:multidrug resistance efflux pump
MGPRRVARALALAFCAAALLTALAPWQQSVTGTGRVIAYAPLERQQTIEAPLDGRVVRWWVQEGVHVDEGELLLDLSDNDPEIIERIERERVITEARAESYRERVASLELRVGSIDRAQEAAVRAAEARVRVARDRLSAAEQAVTAAEADLDTQVLNLARHRVLVDQGLVSQREVELAILAEARSRTAREASRASRDAVRGELEAARAALEQAAGTRTAEGENAAASLSSAQTDLQNAEAALVRLETRMARQETQRIVAPRAGTILRILANQGGEQVKAGDPLLVLVPDTEDRAVELWVDGNDASLIAPGELARLQFEGWPAVQFTGWPSVAVGTFGGVVSFVDATDDGRGDFRVVVTPDPEDEGWPATRFLRQGVRANGWVLLNQVSLGFELWRQFNGFPPTLSPMPTTGPARSSTSGAPSRYSGSSSGSYGGSSSGSYGGSSSGSYGDDEGAY